MRTNSTPIDSFRGGRSRRTHSAEFKAKVVAACRVAGVSKAAVAMAHGINANLARRWVVEAQGHSECASLTPLDRAGPAFVAVQVSAPVPTPAPADIRLEVRRGSVAISVSWPCSAAEQCAAWLREVLR